MDPRPRRLLLAAVLGAPLNAPGADGIIAARLVVKTPGDAYAIMIATHTQLVANPVSRASLSYDVERDFLPLSRLTDSHAVVGCIRRSRCGRLREVQEYSRARPGGAVVRAPSMAFQLFTEAVGQATDAMAITPRPSSARELTDAIRTEQASFAREMKRRGIAPQ